MSEADWKRRPEGGGRFAIGLIGWVARNCGRGVARAFLYPITLYFLLMRAPERNASKAFLSRVFARPMGWFAVARHIHTFASTILDRVFMLSGRMGLFDIRPAGLDPLHAALDQGRGVLVFGSHLGSFDALRALGRRRTDIKLRVLLDKAHNPAITDLLAELDPTLAAGIIDAGQDGPSIALAIKQALDEGALVALLVDRARPGEPSVPAQFLGDTAPFPTAPWLMAAVLKVPVVLAFGLYRGGSRYDLEFELFENEIAIPRRERSTLLAALIQRYASRLEHRLRDAPYNWFNFYDFWHTPVRHPEAVEAAPVAVGPAVRQCDAGQRQHD
jgi:predicted LPLAT superfamily acyltransferase